MTDSGQEGSSMEDGPTSRLDMVMCCTVSGGVSSMVPLDDGNPK
jgi:hypothetical protein